MNELKKVLYKKLGEIVPKDVVIASSTSGLTMSEIQQMCATPERCVIGHPFNPPYLLPLVEIVGGNQTCPDAVAWAGQFYEAAGKSPLIMQKEIPGFVATRLQEALWREALHMVANGEATAADIDTALINGPAPRMAAFDARFDIEPSSEPNHQTLEGSFSAVSKPIFATKLYSFFSIFRDLQDLQSFAPRRSQNFSKIFKKNY